MRDTMGRYRMRIVKAIVITASLGFLFFSHSEAGPPSCAAFNDPGAIFCEDFEDGDRDGWKNSFGMKPGSVTMDSPGLNGTNHAVRFFAKGVSAQFWLDGSFNLTVKEGEKFWVEWVERYDDNFLWKWGREVDENGKLIWQNSNHKDFDLRSKIHAGRTTVTVWDGGGGGKLGRIEIALRPQLTVPNPHNFRGGYLVGANDPSFRLQPGRTYHYFLEMTCGRFPKGVLKLWANDELVMNYSGIQTAPPELGGNCVWVGLFLGGPQSNTAPDGNIWWYDQIRVTRTKIVPWDSPPDTTPPDPPKGVKLK